MEGSSWGERPENPLVNTSWGPFGALLGFPGWVLGGSGRVLKSSWGLLGELSREAVRKMRFAIGLGATWAVLEPSWGLPGPSWGRPGAVLGLFWARLGPSWAFLGVSWGFLGLSWGPLGIILGILSKQRRLSQNVKKP